MSNFQPTGIAGSPGTNKIQQHCSYMQTTIAPDLPKNALKEHSQCNQMWIAENSVCSNPSSQEYIALLQLLFHGIFVLNSLSRDNSCLLKFLHAVALL